MWQIGGCLLLLTGCGASISRYYTANQAVTDVELVDYAGPLSAEPIKGMSLEELIDKRSGEDYLPIGTANYTANGNLNWQGAMVRLGSRLNAEKIDYLSRYIRTETESGVVPSGDFMALYSETIPIHEYCVVYFKKMRHPFVFGVAFGAPDEATARKLGTRNALVITRVVPGKIAWKNDLFKGDVLLEVDGKQATKESVEEFCQNSIGKKMKIQRDGKVIEKTIVAK